MKEIVKNELLGSLKELARKEKIAEETIESDDELYDLKEQYQQVKNYTDGLKEKLKNMENEKEKTIKRRKNELLAEIAQEKDKINTLKEEISNMKKIDGNSSFSQLKPLPL